VTGVTYERALREIVRVLGSDLPGAEQIAQEIASDALAEREDEAC
jgi:hypothetical protein